MVLNTTQGEDFVQEVDMSIRISRVAGIVLKLFSVLDAGPEALMDAASCRNSRELIDEEDYIDGSTSHLTYSPLTW